jgi:hypothetical protein
MDTDNLILLSNAAELDTLIRDASSYWVGWRRIVITLLEVFDEERNGLTIKEVCLLIEKFLPVWFHKGPFGGSTTVNTVAAIFSTGVKDGTLYSIKELAYSTNRFHSRYFVNY